MGAYLSKPKTEVTSSVFRNERMSCGASAMQGWRVSMEDAHTCVLDFDKNTSLFGVFDGHGGSEVAIYAEKHLGEVLKGTDSYKNGNPKQGLKEAFLKIDEDIVTEEGILELKEIAGDAGDDSGEENEADLLAKDAAMPLNDLLAKLKGDIYKCEKEEEKDKHDDDDDDEDEQNEENSKAATNGEVKTNEPGHKDEEKEVKNGKKTCYDKGSPKTNNDVENTEKGDSEDDDESEDKAACDDEKDDDDGDDDEEPDQEEEEEEEDESEEGEDEEDDIEEVTMFKSDEVGYDSGTTAIVAMVRDDLLIVANAGDSRCVLCRNGIALEMSVDHKPEDPKELDRIQKAGGKVNGEGRVNGGLNLSRAIGDHSYKGKSELKAEEQQITALPDIRQIQLTEDDKFMVIACDGIWNVMNSQEVVDFVNDELKKQRKDGEIDLSKVCEKLFEACLAPDTSGDGSGCDNMTCVVVTFDKLKSIKTGKRKSPEQTEINNPDKKSRPDDE